MKRRNGRRNRQLGVAAVEFALVLPLFLTMVLGAIDWGWFFYIDQLVTNCAREGARAGTLRPPPPTTASAVGANDAKSASEAFLLRVKLTSPDVVTAYYTTVGVGASSSGAIQVDISYPVGSLTGFLSKLMPPNAKATAVMRWQ